MFRVYHAFLSVRCSLVVTCWERAGLLALLYVMFYCVFVTFQCGVMGQVWLSRLIWVWPGRKPRIHFFSRRGPLGHTNNAAFTLNCNWENSFVVTGVYILFMIEMYYILSVCCHFESNILNKGFKSATLYCITTYDCSFDRFYILFHFMIMYSTDSHTLSDITCILYCQNWCNIQSLA